MSRAYVVWALRGPYFIGGIRDRDNMGRGFTRRSAKRLARQIAEVGQPDIEVVQRTILASEWGTAADELTTQWAIQTRSSPDDPWERLDNGAGWSDRHGVPYTADDAHKRARAYPAGAARVVHREAMCTDWEADELGGGRA